MLAEVSVLFAFAAGGWFWFDSLRARERALAACPPACERHGLQFLDQSVECVSIRPVRNAEGRLTLRRIYRFEFSDRGDSRRAGSIVMLGPEVEAVTLEPFLLQ